jgi:hypothetical protein
MTFSNVRLCVSTAVAAILVALAALTPPCAAQTKSAAYLQIDASNYREFDRVMKLAEDKGALLRHRFYPFAAMGTVPEEQVPSLLSLGGIRNVFVGAISEDQMEGMSPREIYVAKAYNNIYYPPFGDKGVDHGQMTDTAGDLGDVAIDIGPLKIPEEYMREIREAPPIAGAPFQSAPATSEFMLGHIAVGVILHESEPGYGTQNWVQEEEEIATEEVIAGMDWWANRSPNEELRFSYEMNYAAPVRVEPMDDGVYRTESLWASQSLEHLGYSHGNYFTQCYHYIDDMRLRYRADWGFVVFILHGRPGQDFGDYLGYSYFGGPYNVNAYPVGDFGPEFLDQLIAHETGHTFWALDEYASAPGICTDRAGYLYVENANKLRGDPECKTDVHCIMRSIGGRLLTLQPCYYTEGQIGWRDSDGDGIPDILDTNPVIKLATVDTTNVGKIVAQDTLYSTTVSFEGRAEAVPIKNLNQQSDPFRQDITVERVGAEYRVDVGPWTGCASVDKWFDSPSEEYRFTVSGLEPWTWHTIEIRAVTAHGNVTPDEEVRLFEWFVVPAASRNPYIEILSSNPTSLPVSLGFSLVHPSGMAGRRVSVNIGVYDSMGRKISTLESGRFETGRYYRTEWDGNDLSGGRVAAGVYLVGIISEGNRLASKVLVVP